MSSLPCISHRLFVAAVANEGNAPVETNPDLSQNQLPSAPGCVTAIPLELLESANNSPPPPPRPLRSSPVRAAT